MQNLTTETKFYTTGADVAAWFPDLSEGSIDLRLPMDPSALKTVDFSLDPKLAKPEKVEFAKEGNVLVMRSVLITTREELARILVTHRDEHTITTGASILTSGNPDQDPAQVLGRKITIDPAPDEFELLGYGLSAPSGIRYLFQVYRARILGTEEIVPKKERASLVPLFEALDAVKDKRLEANVLRKVIFEAA